MKIHNSSKKITFIMGKICRSQPHLDKYLRDVTKPLPRAESIMEKVPRKKWCFARLVKYFLTNFQTSCGS